jgi:hypothetical protein
MKGRVITIADIGDDELAAWQELADSAVEPNPLFGPACLVPAARHLPNGPDIRLVVAEEDGMFMGCFPVLRTSPLARPCASWPGIGRPTFSTQVRRNRYDGTPLVRPERGEETVMSLLGALVDVSSSQRAGILVLEAMTDDGPTGSWVRVAAERLGLPLHVVHTYERPIVRRRQDLSYRDDHSQKARRDWRRRKRQLGEKLGGPVELVDRSGDAAVLDTLLAIEAAGYKGRIGGRRSDRFRLSGDSRGGAFLCWPGEPEWLKEMCDRLRSDSRLLLYSLQVGDTIVAVQLMARSGPGLFLLVTVFDEAYARYAPGMLLQLEAVDRIHKETDAQWLDCCTYEGNDTMLRTYPDRRSVATLLVGLGGPVDRTCLAVSVPAWRFVWKQVRPGSPLGKNEFVRRLLEWTSSKVPVASQQAE